MKNGASQSPPPANAGLTRHFSCAKATNTKLSQRKGEPMNYTGLNSRKIYVTTYKDSSDGQIEKSIIDIEPGTGGEVKEFENLEELYYWYLDNINGARAAEFIGWLISSR